MVSGIGFLGAGVIMREGMNIRGLNTAATLWCSAGIGVLCGLGLYWNAVVATGVILYGNILLREAAQRINMQPQQQDVYLEVRYLIQVTCGADIARPDQLEVCAEIMATPARHKKKLKILFAA